MYLLTILSAISCNLSGEYHGRIKKDGHEKIIISDIKQNCKPKLSGKLDGEKKTFKSQELEYEMKENMLYITLPEMLKDAEDLQVTLSSDDGKKTISIPKEAPQNPELPVHGQSAKEKSSSKSSSSSKDGKNKETTKDKESSSSDKNKDNGIASFGIPIFGVLLAYFFIF